MYCDTFPPIRVWLHCPYRNMYSYAAAAPATRATCLPCQALRQPHNAPTRRQQRGLHRLRPCASRVEADPYESLDAKTDLREFGYSEAEAAAEEAWDDSETDPTAINFEDMFSLKESLPEEMKEQLQADQHGPPVRVCELSRGHQLEIRRVHCSAATCLHPRAILTACFST